MPDSGFELGTDGPITIVVGVDGSESSSRAAAYAGGLARRQGASLVAVYVRRPVGGVLTVADRTGASVALEQLHQDDVETELRTAFEHVAPTYGIDAQLVIRTGDPFREICRLAESHRADAVVVGASTTLGHRVAGSLAIRLVRQAKWPVTVVP
jgi:nucleotide-binding universal stress UspA family protein